MNCPECGRKTQVYETRIVGEVVYRRRHCAQCNDTVVTKEVIAEGETIPTSWRVRDRSNKKIMTTSAHNPFGL